MGLIDYFTGYPKCVFAILGNEFCERFSFYGMKAILVLFLNRALLYDDSTSTTIYHTFNMFCYFSPLLGAMIADGFLGKYKTILYISIMYAVGNGVMAVGAIPFEGEGQYMAWISFIGLALIALGTGGIKPCVAAFGADQFDDDMTRQKESFFSLFYMAINSGSLLSILITPILRSSVFCFDDNCWSLAFGVPAGLMVVAVIMFVIGTKWYKRFPPGENIIAKLFGCIGKALAGKMCGKGPKQSHWLDYAKGSYSDDFVEDVKGVMSVLFMFIPLPMFWALFDQQGSRWTLQAGTMNGELGDVIIEPDMVQVINPIFILTLVPVCESLLFPCMARLNIPNGPMVRLALGLFLAGLSFVASAILQIQIDNSQPSSVPAGMVRVRVMNAAPCENVTVHSWSHDFRASVGHTGATEYMDLDDVGAVNISVTYRECHSNYSPGDSDFTMWTRDEEIYNIIIGAFPGDNPQMSYFVQNQTLRTGRGECTMRLFNALPEDLELDMKSTSGRERHDREYYALPQFYNGTLGRNMSEVVQWDTYPYDTWRVKKVTDRKDIDEENDDVETELGRVESRNGAVYTVIVHRNMSDKDSVTEITDIKKSTIHILWQAPQYFIISLGEVLFSVTGLAFAYSQSPPYMKSVLQAAWLMTIAVGNLIVVIITGVGTIPDQVWEFVLFAGLMFLTVIVFSIMAQFYEFIDPDKWKTPDPDEKKQLPSEKGGVQAYDNKAFDGDLKSKDPNSTYL